MKAVGVTRKLVLHMSIEHQVAVEDISMQRFLVGIKDPEDVNGVGSFIDGKGDKVRESLHGLAADVPIADSGGGGQLCDALKIVGDQVGKAVAQIGGQGVVILDGGCDIVGGRRGNENSIRH